MAQTLQEWLSTEVKQLQKMPVGELSNVFFFRDPICRIVKSDTKAINALSDFLAEFTYVKWFSHVLLQCYS